MLDLLLVLNQSFFMGAFFLISALFVPGSYDREGAQRFLRERLLRLGVPLLVRLLVLRPVVTIGRYTAARDAAVQQGAELPYWQYYLPQYAALFVVGLVAARRGWLDGPSRTAGRVLSAHAYTVFVIHPLVLVGLGYALHGVPAPAVAKFALLAVLALPLCWAAAYPVRALPGAREVL